jgi:hypothetical protein
MRMAFRSGAMSSVNSCKTYIMWLYFQRHIQLYINDTPSQTPGVNLALFADDTCIYATDRKEGYVLRRVQRVLNSMATWCESWNIKINEDKIREIYFTHRNRLPDSLLTLNGRNIPFVNSVKYLGTIFHKRMHGGYTYR